jgi:hypothetical protein
VLYGALPGYCVCPVAVLDDSDPDVTHSFDHAHMPHLMASLAADVFRAMAAECHPSFVTLPSHRPLSTALPSLDDMQREAQQELHGVEELAVLIPWLVPRLHATMLSFNLSIDDADTQDLMPYLLHQFGPVHEGENTVTSINPIDPTSLSVHEPVTSAWTRAFHFIPLPTLAGVGACFALRLLS